MMVLTIICLGGDLYALKFFEFVMQKGRKCPDRSDDQRPPSITVSPPELGFEDFQRHRGALVRIAVTKKAADITDGGQEPTAMREAKGYGRS